MKCVLRAWGQLKRGFEVLALCEIFLEFFGIFFSFGIFFRIFFLSNFFWNSLG